MAKVENQLRYLLRSTCDKAQNQRDQEVELGIERLRTEIKSLSCLREQFDAIEENGLNIENDKEKTAAPTDIIRGHEGKAGEIYLRLLPKILRLEKGDLLYFSGRNRRPPHDPFNALLS